MAKPSSVVVTVNVPPVPIAACSIAVDTPAAANFTVRENHQRGKRRSAKEAKKSPPQKSNEGRSPA